MKILAIESSCDETAAAVLETIGRETVILSSVVASQIEIHTRYGGVVPEVAARAHIENIIPVIQEALDKAGTKLDSIDRIAVTAGPGLIGSLVVGVETAKAIALAKNIPLYPINHLEGHIYASFLGGISNTKFKIPNNIHDSDPIVQNSPQFPLITLLVSGGNSLLIYMKGHFDYQVIGQTIDDAAGEAFDKGAKLLGLGYPGGPIISKISEAGDPNRFDFPIIDLTPSPTRGADGFLVHQEPSLDFSFSGLKTSLLNKVKTLPTLTAEDKNDFAAGFEQAIVKSLIQNSRRAIDRFQPKSFILAGGVAANKKLRDELGTTIMAEAPKTKYFVPDANLCGDNAAMIGAVAAFREPKAKNSDFAAEPGLKLLSQK